MVDIYKRVGQQADASPDMKVILTHSQRERGRMRVFSTDGHELCLFLKRGAPLEVGEYLRSECGRHILVEGAVEEVTVARCDDWATFVRACYHLGNRHVKVQIGDRCLRILPDHVLEDMLLQLGMKVEASMQVFIPESGAYSGGSHHHHHEAQPRVADTLRLVSRHEHQ